MSENTARRRLDDLKAGFAEERAERLRKLNPKRCLPFLEREGVWYVWGPGSEQAYSQNPFTEEELAAVAELMLEDEEHIQKRQEGHRTIPMREDLEIALYGLPSASEETERRRRDELKAGFAGHRTQRFQKKERVKRLGKFRPGASICVWGSDAPAFSGKLGMDEELEAVAELILEDEEYIQRNPTLREAAERALEVFQGEGPLRVAGGPTLSRSA